MLHCNKCLHAMDDYAVCKHNPEFSQISTLPEPTNLSISIQLLNWGVKWGSWRFYLHVLCCLVELKRKEKKRRRKNIKEILVRIHKNEQLLDWPFTRLLLEALYIKMSNYLQVNGIDL